MSRAPTPLFETYEDFIQLDFSVSEPDLACVRAFLNEFPAELEAQRGYAMVRNFLRAFSLSGSTFNSYRTQGERLLLWSLLIHRKPLTKLKRQDALDYLDFCRSPPAHWVGPSTRSRFVLASDPGVARVFPIVANPNWYPFNLRVAKQAVPSLPGAPYSAAKGTLKQVCAICSRLFEFLVEDGATAANPFRLIKKLGRFDESAQEPGANRALTPLQWDYVLETAGRMAADDPQRHERTLFVLSTLFAMYLRVSDLAGRKNWKPTMGDFKQDSEGNWWFYAVGKGNKSGKIAVRDEYINQYLIRYRRVLGLSDLPARDETTPLLSTLRGRSGLSDRQVRALLQLVFDQTLQTMQQEGRLQHEMESLRIASAHWLRHTSATFDAPLRNPKDLQVDLRHSNLSTTQNTYYHSHDQERAHSVKRISMRDRG